MKTSLNTKNDYFKVLVDGETYVKFITGGKYEVEVIVDLDSWQNYLHKHHWTAIKRDNYIQIKTSLNKHSHRLHRMIIENEYSELDYWGNTIDHKNNNPLDNRKSNLRIYNSKLNSTNIKSKYEEDDMHLIHKQYSNYNGQRKIHGYKVHTNIFDKTIYKNFKTIEEAREYRDTYVIPIIDEEIKGLIKKTRDIEFERGLRDKLNNNERVEVIEILKKYNIEVNEG